MSDFMWDVQEAAVRSRHAYEANPCPATIDQSIMLLEAFRDRVTDLWMDVFSSMEPIQGTNGPEDPMWEALWKVRFGMTRSESVKDYLEKYGKKEK